MSHEPQVTLQHEPSLDAVDQNAGLVANKLTTTLGLKGSRGAMLSDSSGQERLQLWATLEGRFFCEECDKRSVRKRNGIWRHFTRQVSIHSLEPAYSEGRKRDQGL